MSRDNLNKLKEIILLVDDNYTNIELLKNILEKDDYEIAFAPNGEQALDLATKLNPNLILLDIMMPGIDGFEICQRLKENEMTRGIPVIFISAKSKHEDIVKGFEIGGTDYITKPFNISEVLARVRTHLQIQNLMAQKEKSEEKAKAYAQELKRSNQDFEDFAHLASHDLQEPLRKILSFGNRLIQQSSGLSEKNKDYVERMQRASVRMMNFIDGLLEYSKITTIPRPYKITDLGKVIQHVLEDLDLQIKNNNATIQVGTLPTIELDPIQISMLLQNLVSNAIKYHRQDVAPIVNLTSSYDKKEQIWTIEVSDNGIGIEEKNFARIFKQFQRLHGRSAYEGNGLGLAICKKIVDRHGGTLKVNSVLGKGSTFIISLPKIQSSEKLKHEKVS